MLSYKRENGWNEKLMGWEGGITTKEKLHGLEPTHPKSFHLDFVNSIANSAKCFHSRISNIFQPLTINERIKDIDKEWILESVVKTTCVHLKFHLLAVKIISLFFLCNCISNLQSFWPPKARNIWDIWLKEHN